MRLRLFLATLPLVVGLWLPSAVPPASGSTPAVKNEGSRSAARSAYFGILGEVACPGVYELPADCTFGQLVRCAGGITHDSDGNARVIRGARFAQQLFVASSDSAVLYPGDFVVIERSAAEHSATKLPKQSRPAGFNASVAPAPQATEVQIGFLNLIDRPVVMKIRRELASPARIVELLGQPPELVENIRIVAPSRNNARRSVNPDCDANLVRCGTVLIFPAHSVRLASLPLLPDPIVPSQSRPTSLLSTAAPLPPRVDTDGSQSGRVEATHHSGTQVAAPRMSVSAICRTEPAPRANGGVPPQEQIERLIYAPESTKSMSQMLGSPFRNVAQKEWERRRQGEKSSHTRPYFFFFVLAGAAVLAMLFTIGSMGLRWINAARSWERDQTTGILPPGPALSPVTGVNRQIRIDANQPQTRLGIDLAVFERARARHTPGAASLPDPTPKAA
jgi:hypothetical protein